MSGRKQHYIPQSLLRGFGRRGKGKAVQVTVYSSDRGVFTTATDGVAARRYFYSEPDEIVGAETLDDRITAYETWLAETLAEFRDIVPGHAVDAMKAAKAVSHLGARQAHLRDSFASMAQHLLDGTAMLFRDKDWLWKAMGLDDSVLNETVRSAIRNAYDRFGSQLKQTGLNKLMFERWIFARMKIEFESNFAEQSEILQLLFVYLQEQIHEIAREGHIKALARSLAPESRIETLKDLSWKLEPGPASGLVLPDCVATSWSAETGHQPLMYAGKDINAVFMPLRHDRLLVGKCGHGSGNARDAINEVSVTCSWDFFIARDRTPEFQQLVPRIGERARNIAEEIARKALKHYD